MRKKKRWSWKSTFGKAGIAAVAAGVVAAIGTAIIGPGALIMGALTLVGGLAGGIGGDAWGYHCDDPFDESDSFGSAALYTSVVTGTLAALFDFLALNQLAAHPDLAKRGFVLIGALASFLGVASRSLIDDFRAANERRRMQP